MPYVHVSAARELGAAEKDALYEKLAALMPVLPGKNRENTMIRIEGGCFIRKGGEADCLMMDVRLMGVSPEEAKKEFCEGAMRLFEEELGVPQRAQYINIIELEHWASGGVYR